MRGIAMAEVAEIDLMMEDTIAEAFRNAGTTLDNVARTTAHQLRDALIESTGTVESVNFSRQIDGLIRNPRLFSSVH